MDNKRPVYWHQGLFLQPHHFQQHDLYVQGLHEPLHRFMTPYFWGIAGFTYAKGALENLTFEIVSGEFLFPDGTFVDYPGNGVVAGRSFEDAWVEMDKPFTIYLGLKKIDEAGVNSTELSDGDEIISVATRYVTRSEPENVGDLYETGPAGQVKKMSFVLKLFWEIEKEMASEFLLLPLARLEKDGEAIQVSPRFIPPALTVQSSHFLEQIVRDIRDQLAGRSRQLNEYKAQRGIHTSDFGARDMVFMLALRSLNRYVPLLFHFTETVSVHPWQVYGLLRQLIGELSTFSNQINAVGEREDGEVLLGAYEHNNLSGCFLDAQSLISLLLDEITAGPEHVIALQFDGTYFTADMNPSQFVEGNRYYLVVETEEDFNRVRDALQGIAKLGSRESLPLLIARALPGVELEHLATPPQELPRRAHCLYFQVNHHCDQWANVKSSRNIGLYWDDAPDDFKAELMVVGRS